MNGFCKSIFTWLLVVSLGFRAEAKQNDSDFAHQDGYAILVDAIRYSGGSGEVVQTGRFEFSRAQSRPLPTGEEYDRQYRAYVQGMKDRCNEVDAENRALIEEAIANAPQLFEDLVQRRSRAIRSLRFVFEGVSPFRRSAVEYQTADSSGGLSDRYVRISGTLHHGQANETKQFVSHHIDRHPGDIGIELNAYAQEEPNQFGRLRGRTSLMLTAFLLDENDIASGRLDPQKIRVGQELNLDVLRESNGKRGVRIVDREELEGSMCLVVKTDDPGARNLRGWLSEIKVWIDPGRGFITPRIIEYLDGQPAMEYVSSDYQYLDDAGLWWPSVHEVTNHSEKVVIRYEIDLENSCVNCPIAEEEFELAIEPGNHVTDSRNGDSNVLVVQKPYRMKFDRDGRLNFDSATDIARSDMPPENRVLQVFTGKSRVPWFVAANVVGIGLLLLALKFHKRLKNST